MRGTVNWYENLLLPESAPTGNHFCGARSAALLDFSDEGATSEEEASMVPGTAEVEEADKDGNGGDLFYYFSISSAQLGYPN